MATTVINLLAGTPQLFIGPQGEAKTDVDNLPPGTTVVVPAGNWRAVGATMEDYAFTVDTTSEGVDTNENLGDVKEIAVKELVTFSLVFAETDMQAYTDAINLSTLTTTAAAADQTGQDNLTFGDKSGGITEFSLQILGLSPESGSRLIFVPKAVQVEAVEAALSKSHKGLPVGWKFITDPSRAAGQTIFTIDDITADATS